jgi:hypothetical protein
MRRNLLQSVSGRKVLDILSTGVLGSSVPSTGQNGPSYLYNDVVENNLELLEVRGRIFSTTLPAGSWYAWNDGRLEVANTVSTGQYTASYTLYVLGTSYGTGVITFNVGEVGVTITSQPTSASVTAPTTQTFTVIATGFGTLTYQWQRSTNSGSSWTPISGATSSSYITPATSVSGGNANSGDQYRVVVSNGIATVTSNTATLTVASAVDVTLPVLTGTISVTNLGPLSYTISWPLASDNIAVASYEYRINGGSYVNTGTVRTANISGRPSNFSDTVEVRARDAAGNASTPALSVVVNAGLDVTPPSLSGSITVSSITVNSYNLSWPAATDNVGVSSYEYRINGGAYTNVGNATTTSVTGRPFGFSDTVEVRARDAAGNSSSLLTVTINAAPDINAPTFTGAVTASALTFTGYTASWPAATDNVGVSSYEYRINGGAYTNVGNSLSVVISSRPNNFTDLFEVRARDAAGNTSSILALTINAAVDTTAPVLIGSMVSSSVGPTSYTLLWPVATDNVGVSSYEYRINGGAYVNVGNITAASITGRTLGFSDTVEVRARDAAGNVSSPPLSILVVSTADVTPPVFTGSIVPSSINASGYTLTWPTASDNIGVIAYDYRINGGAYVSVGNFTSTTISGRPNNFSDFIEVRARDAAGNSSAPLSTTVVANVDSTAPVLTGSIVASNITANSYSLTWPTASDNIGVTSYEYRINGGNYINVGNATTVNLSSRPPNFSDFIEVRARDAAGNSSTPLLSLTVSAALDNTLPVLVGSLTPSSITSSGYVVNWPTATDNISIIAYDYRINSGSWNSVGLATGTTITGRPPNFSDFIEVRARDAAGNVSSPPLSTTVNAAVTPDNQAPNFTGDITVTNITITAYTLNWVAATDNIAVTGYEVRLNGGAWAAVGNVLSYTINDRTPNSQDLVEVRAFDAVGNRSDSVATTVTTLNLALQMTPIPTTATVGIPIQQIAVSVGSSFVGSVTIVPTDGGGGGTFTPSQLVLTSGQVGSFAYTANSIGSKLITLINNRGYSNPAPQQVIVSAYTPPVTTPGGSTRSIIVDLRTAIAEHNVVRNAAAFSLNYAVDFEVSLRSLTLSAPSSVDIPFSAARGTFTMMRTSAPLSVSLRLRNGVNINLLVKKMFILDEDIVLMTLTNTSVTTSATVSILQG